MLLACIKKYPKTRHCIQLSIHSLHFLSTIACCRLIVSHRSLLLLIRTKTKMFTICEFEGVKSLRCQSVTSNSEDNYVSMVMYRAGLSTLRIKTSLLVSIVNHFGI